MTRLAAFVNRRAGRSLLGNGTALVVPALMALLGKWNFCGPAPLCRPHARIGPSEATA
jgi:hypothetical protein